MLSPQDFTNPQKTLHPSAREKDVISQMQLEMLSLVRIAPDETTENWQKVPPRLGDWSSTLESEISSFLW